MEQRQNLALIALHEKVRFSQSSLPQLPKYGERRRPRHSQMSKRSKKKSKRLVDEVEQPSSLPKSKASSEKQSAKLLSKFQLKYLTRSKNGTQITATNKPLTKTYQESHSSSISEAKSSDSDSRDTRDELKQPQNPVAKLQPKFTKQPRERSTYRNLNREITERLRQPPSQEKVSPKGTTAQTWHNKIKSS